METETQILERELTANHFERSEADCLRVMLGGVELTPWFETIDDSPYALEDWLRALVAFDGWLTSNRIEARPVETMLGYLECCTLSLATTMAPPDFAALALENLDQYGFDATRPASTEPGETDQK
ncbi:MAG: hypothetical protein KDN19_21140 [Verrucomicrobiae bacterium]|nr:hypothetical protein [Verrucomicrobiae bacterium]